MNRHTAAALAAAATALAFAAPAAAAPKDFTVDDNRAECKKAQFTTIQDAIAAAPPGATIRVCPGTYAGPISVNKPVVLDGPRNGNGDAPSRSDLSREAVVTNTGEGGFDVQASGVTIDGFTVQGTGVYTPAQYPAAGVYLRTGAERSITDNVLRGNGLGVYFEGTHEDSEVERNGFEANRRTTPGGQPSGGLFAAGGPLNDVSISHNGFTADEQFAMNIGNGSAGGLVIEHNDAVDEPTVVVIGNSAGARIAHNKGRDLRGTGVFLFGGNSDVLVAHNEFEGTGAGNGIVSQPSFGAGPDTALTIEHNRLSNFLFDGIRLRNGVTASTVAFNLIDEVGRDGLRADGQSSGNTFTKNNVFVTGEHDCHDDTAGPGTAGTANVWEDNKADTENRPGLCVTE